MTWRNPPVTYKFIVKSLHRNCVMYLHLIDLKGKNSYLLLVFLFADLSFSNPLPIPTILRCMKHFFNLHQFCCVFN